MQLSIGKDFCKHCRFNPVLKTCRLTTLNVLLSFSQFEREVTVETVKACHGSGNGKSSRQRQLHYLSTRTIPGLILKRCSVASKEANTKFRDSKEICVIFVSFQCSYAR